MTPTGDPRHHLGRDGERRAEKFLCKSGMRVVARRVATPAGEVDLLMLDGDCVVFVEVKTRSDRRAADPEDAITADKRRRVLLAAEHVLHRRRWEDRPCRFDVVVVVGAADDAAPELRHYPDMLDFGRR